MGEEEGDVGTKVSIRAVRVHLEGTMFTKWHLFWDVRVKWVIDIYRHTVRTAHEKYIEMDLSLRDQFNLNKF